MIQFKKSHGLAVLGIVAAGAASTGCSSFQGEQAQTAVQPEVMEYTGLVAYDDASLPAFSLVSGDQIGFIAFSEQLVAESLPAATSEELATVETN